MVIHFHRQLDWIKKHLVGGGLVSKTFAILKTGVPTPRTYISLGVSWSTGNPSFLETWDPWSKLAGQAG